jgi:methyl-accepting chemotaxis protein
MAGKNKRRQYPIIDRSLQYRFLALSLSYSMIIVVCLASCLLVPDILGMTNEALTIELRAAAAQRVIDIHSRLWPAVVALVCVFGIHSTRIFHRIIGRLYRFRWAFQKVSQGELNFRLKLRKRDCLQREEEAFNQMIEKLAERCGKIRSAGLDSLESLGALEQSLAEFSGWRDMDHQFLSDHRHRLEVLVEHTKLFDLEAKEQVAEREA